MSTRLGLRRVMILAGASGCGKGTLYGRLVHDVAFNTTHGLAVTHQSVGDMLRGLLSETGTPGLSPSQRRRVKKQELMGGEELAHVLAGEVRRARRAAG